MDTQLSRITSPFMLQIKRLYTLWQVVRENNEKNSKELNRINPNSSLFFLPAKKIFSDLHVERIFRKNKTMFKWIKEEKEEEDEKKC